MTFSKAAKTNINSTIIAIAVLISIALQALSAYWFNTFEYEKMALVFGLVVFTALAFGRFAGISDYYDALGSWKNLVLVFVILVSAILTFGFVLLSVHTAFWMENYQQAAIAFGAAGSIAYMIGSLIGKAQGVDL